MEERDSEIQLIYIKFNFFFPTHFSSFSTQTLVRLFKSSMQLAAIYYYELRSESKNEYYNLFN